MTTTSKKAKVQAAQQAVTAGKVTTASELQVINDVKAVAEQATEQGKKAKTAKQQAAQEKRDWLRAISADFQAQRDIMQLMGAEYIPTINEMLHAYYAKQNNITELNTFDQWKEKGYQVRKGEKAYLFWGKPRAKYAVLTEEPTTEDEQGEPTETTARANEYYPICYLFDISQCHKVAI